MGVRCFQKPVQDKDLEATSVGQGKIRLVCQLRAWSEKCHCHARQVTGGDGPARPPSAWPTLTPITARPECPAPPPASPLRAAGAPEAGLPPTFVTPVASRPRKGLSLLPFFLARMFMERAWRAPSALLDGGREQTGASQKVTSLQSRGRGRVAESARGGHRMGEGKRGQRCRGRPGVCVVWPEARVQAGIVRPQFPGRRRPVGARLGLNLAAGSTVFTLTGHWGVSAPRRDRVTLQWPARPKSPRLLPAARRAFLLSPATSLFPVVLGLPGVLAPVTPSGLRGAFSPRLRCQPCIWNLFQKVFPGPFPARQGQSQSP